MAIVVTRSGEPISAPAPLTQAQKDSAWAYIVRAWARKHPDALRALMDETEPAAQSAPLPRSAVGA